MISSQRPAAQRPAPRLSARSSNKVRLDGALPRAAPTVSATRRHSFPMDVYYLWSIPHGDGQIVVGALPYSRLSRRQVHAVASMRARSDVALCPGGSPRIASC